MNVDTMLRVWLYPLGSEPNAEGRLVVLIFEWPCCRWFVFCQIGSRPVGFFVLAEGPVLQTGEGVRCAWVPSVFAVWLVCSAPAIDVLFLVSELGRRLLFLDRWNRTGIEWDPWSCLGTLDRMLSKDVFRFLSPQKALKCGSQNLH